MGNEAKCKATYRGRTATGKALFETDEIVFRGAFRVVVPLADIRKVATQDGNLSLGFSGGTLVLTIGPKDAARWAERIKNPKSVLDKLGVKPEHRISIVGDLAAGFVKDLTKRAKDVAYVPRKGSDVVFYAANARADLREIPSLGKSLAPAGALWVVRPKGKTEITESDVMAAGKAAGLVDVKVVRFSETHTAEKFVIPVAKR